MFSLLLPLSAHSLSEANIDIIMLAQQPSMVCSVVETSNDEEQHFNVGIAIGFRERQHSTVGQRRSDTSYSVDEQTKIQLAIQVSQAALPGASAEQSDIRSKPSDGQLVHMGYLRRLQKNRNTGENRLEDHLMEQITSNEELIDFQGRMHDFRYEENQRANSEDEVMRKQNRRRIAWFVIGLMGVTVAIAVAVAVLGGLLGSSSVAAIDGDETSLFHDCYMYNDTQPSDRFLQLRNLVSSAGAWEHSPIDSVGSSQRAALCWLSDFDSFELEFVEGIEYEVLQRFALAATYYHFVGTTPETRTQKLSGSNWLENEHVCEWDFVVCDYPSNKVTELFLDGIDLTRPIPDEVALMSDLVCLKLTRSQLTGQVPSTLSRLTQLQELDLRYNTLMNTIPSELGLLAELKTLNLGQNHLQGEIPPQLFDIPNLLDLVLIDNNLTGMLPSALSTQTGLISLSVERNSLTGTIPDISRLTRLTYLGFGYNEIEDSFPDISRMRELGEWQNNELRGFSISHSHKTPSRIAAIV